MLFCLAYRSPLSQTLGKRAVGEQKILILVLTAAPQALFRKGLFAPRQVGED